MKQVNHMCLGVVVQNNDPEQRGRIKVFVPHVSVTVYKKWNEVIDGVWIELAGDLAKDNAAETDIKKLNEDLGQLFKDFKVGDNSKNKDEIYKKLMEKEIYIRRLQNTLGKGTALKDIDEDDFE